MREPALAAESPWGVIGSYRKAQRRRRQRTEKGATWTVWKSVQFDAGNTCSEQSCPHTEERLSRAGALLLEGFLAGGKQQQRLAKPSIVIAELRRLSTQLPSPKRSLSCTAAPSQQQVVRSTDFGSGSQKRRNSRTGPTRCRSARPSPLMRFFEQRHSTSDADSTAASSNLDFQSEVDKDDQTPLRCRRDSQLINLLKARTEQIWPYRSTKDPFKKNNLSGMPAGFESDDGTTSKEGQELCLSVKTGKEDDDTRKLQLLLGARDEAQSLVDTMGTLSPVPSNPLMMSESSITEDGLTLFVNPLVFCETADEDTLTGAARRSTRPCTMDLDEVLGLPKTDGRSAENHQLKKIEEKMVRQVSLRDTLRDEDVSQESNREGRRTLLQAQSSSKTEEGAQTVSVEEKVVDLESEPSVPSESIQKVLAVNELARSWSMKPWQQQQRGCVGNTTSHFREDTMWGGGVGSRSYAAFRSKPETDASNAHIQFCAKDEKFTSVDAMKAAKRRAFIKSRSMKEARDHGLSHWCPCARWADEKAFDVAVERAFENVKPLTLVRKGAKGALLHSAGCGSTKSAWRGISSLNARMVRTTDDSWGGDLQLNPLWSGEAPTMISNSVWSDTDDWPQKMRKETSLRTAELTQSRDKLWGGICIGLLAWLAILF